ncbi:DUF4224 domain-containing protein [Paludibacterium paludis]
MFLTATEVVELTGRTRTSGQIRWLRDTGWLFEVNAAGRPIIARSYAERRMCGTRTDTVIGSSTIEPNFAALNR